MKKKLFQAIPSFVVIATLSCGPTFFASGCGGSAPKGDAGQVQAMPPEEKDSIKRAMEANRQSLPGKGQPAQSK